MLWTKQTIFYVTSSYVILYVHTSPPFCQHGKNAQQQLVQPLPSVCVVVGSSRKEITTQGERITEFSEERKVTVMRKDRIINWASLRENLSSGFSRKRVLNQSPQLQRLARRLKFHL